jgi:peptidoglycan/LPS O-acetylase OafA/YrhL
MAKGGEVQYRPAIDGLRAVAVLAVFIFHLNRQWLPGGFVGVDVFFVISGYLITSILLRDCKRNTFSVGKFYQRRIARLFPAFLTVALATLVVAFFLYSDRDLSMCGANLTAATLSLANMKYMWQGNYFTLSPDGQPFLHYWSLSVEEQFYMLFPFGFFLLYSKTPRYKTAILTFLCGASLLACIALTQTKSTWAFFLLPTRAWELLAGGILANTGAPRLQSDNRTFQPSLSLVGLALIAISLFAIKEGPTFPGYSAILPVLGTLCVLTPGGASNGLAERLLSTGPMVLVGRMSYSLYLWHWPVFSFIDYRFYLASPLFRTGLKVGLSLAATALCFYWIESPGRVFFNHPRRRGTSFAFLATALLVFVPLGIAVRKTSFVNAEESDVARGGVVFNQAKENGSIVLMGDSNGSVYGKAIKEIARELSFKLNVISAAGLDPLPRVSGEQNPDWLDSLAVVKRERPDFLVMVCNWQMKLNGDKSNLELALNQLQQYARHLILITQPPELPGSGSRESMRNGSRPPFMEDPAERALRMKSNALVKGLQGDNVTVIDIEPLFGADDGRVFFADNDGNQFYQDKNHLSGVAANLVRPYVLKVMTQYRPALHDQDRGSR